MNGLHADIDILSLWVIKYVFMYSLCVLHLSDLIVFIYQVWVGNCMCVFPVISPLFIKQNVLSLNTTAGIESDMVTVTECVKSQGFKKKKKRKGVAVSNLIQSVVEKHL